MCALYNCVAMAGCLYMDETLSSLYYDTGSSIGNLSCLCIEDLVTTISTPKNYSLRMNKGICGI